MPLNISHFIESNCYNLAMSIAERLEKDSLEITPPERYNLATEAVNQLFDKENSGVVPRKATNNYAREILVHRGYILVQPLAQEFLRNKIDASEKENIFKRFFSHILQ